MDDRGGVLGLGSVAELASGLRQLHEIVACHGVGNERVVLGLATDRPAIAAALGSAEYETYLVETPGLGRPGHLSGAEAIARSVRTDRDPDRRLWPGTGTRGATLAARALQLVVWRRSQHVDTLREVLAERYPAALAAFGNDVVHPDALAVLSLAPSPEEGRTLTHEEIASALSATGRLDVERRAGEIALALASPSLGVPEQVRRAQALLVRSLVALVTSAARELDSLERVLAGSF